MESYLINVFLEFIPYLIFVSISIGVYWLTCKKPNKQIWQGTGVVLLLCLIVAATGTDTGYKHTTSYNKEQDIKSLQLRQDSGRVEIKDISRKSESAESRKERFDEMVKYKDDDQ